MAIKLNTNKGWLNKKRELNVILTPITLNAEFRMYIIPPSFCLTL